VIAFRALWRSNARSSMIRVGIMPEGSMATRIDEIADRIYRLSTFVAEIAAPAGFTFNQFLMLADEPVLFDTGKRRMFPDVRAALNGFCHQSDCGGSPSGTTSPTSVAR
jgi:hypothetical protein